jgi:LytS/YehU family sensor histidine kinase
MRYPLYAAIYLVVTGLVFLLRFAQRMQMREKIKMREDIARLQMKAINQQIDPHFTLNAFNSIASLLKREKGETAYEYFMRFTDLIRISLVTTDEVFRTLEEELTVVRNYLDLQKLRFGDRFNYEIIISEDVNPRQLIPKMIIQTYTENAVKHGFRETRSGGLLKVDVVVKDGYLEIAVQDNGMGRKKAGALKKESTGLGLAAMDRYIELLNRNYDLKIEKEIIDLADQNGEPAGTRVVIKIP